MNLEQYLNEKEGTMMPYLKKALKSLEKAEKDVKKSVEVSDNMADNIVSQAELNMMRRVETVAKRITYHLEIN